MCSLHPQEQELGCLLALAQPWRRGLGHLFLRHLEDVAIYDEEGCLGSWPRCSLKGVIFSYYSES